MTPSVFVFLGPSLSLAERATWQDKVTILPPVSAGDLLRLPAAAGDLVGIVDGYFRGRAPVRHKEILDLLDRGVQVHGAASMGALRAAELADFGMTGHGRIFRDYRNGTLVADDEVALLHGTAQEDYKAYTEALVNVRHALAGGVADGTLSRQAAEAVITAGRRMPFTERTRDALLAAARLDAPTTRAVRRVLESGEGEDLKRRDALELLNTVTTDRHTPPRPNWELERTSYLVSWRALHSGQEHPEAGFVADIQVHDFCRIQAVDYPTFHEQVALTALLDGGVLFPASAPSPHVTPAAAVLPARDIQVHDAVENDSSPHCAVVHRLQQLGLVGDFAQELGWLRWCTRAETGLAPEIRLAKAATRACFPHQVLATVNPFIDALKARGSFERARNALVHALLFNRHLVEQHPGRTLDRLRVARIRQWYGQQWKCGDDLELEEVALERGYATIEQFTTAARPFYLHAAHCRTCPPFAIGSPIGEQP